MTGDEVRQLREAILRELPGIDNDIQARWVALAFDRAAVKVGAAQARGEPEARMALAAGVAIFDAPAGAGESVEASRG